MKAFYYVWYWFGWAVLTGAIGVTVAIAWLFGPIVTTMILSGYLSMDLPLHVIVASILFCDIVFIPFTLFWLAIAYFPWAENSGDSWKVWKRNQELKEKGQIGIA